MAVTTAAAREMLLRMSSPSAVPLWSCRRARAALVASSPARPGFFGHTGGTAALTAAGNHRQLSSTTTVPQEERKSAVASQPNLTSHADYLHLEVVHGLPRLTVPLPSRGEPCVFTLRPVLQNVGDLLEMLRVEDPGIDRAVIRDTNSVRVAANTSIGALLEADRFELVINDRTHHVLVPDAARAPVGAESVTAEETARLGDIRALVGRLYESLHVEEHQAAQERRLVAQAERLRAELEPLEERRIAAAVAAEKRTSHLTWLGLGMMGVQFGILARLTWWEYSWDIMEPGTQKSIAFAPSIINACDTSPISLAFSVTV